MPIQITAIRGAAAQRDDAVAIWRFGLGDVWSAVAQRVDIAAVGSQTIIDEGDGALQRLQPVDLGARTAQEQVVLQP
ncbi:MAG: hypothetical protein OXF90_05985, partial [Chloroflexi bacterium]|nr:hypothetical protein [Chloroflexota bacterium]